MAKTPKIRFKNFSDEWVESRLDEIGDFQSNGVDKLSKPNEFKVNLLNYMDVYNQKNITAKNCNKLMQVTATLNQLIKNNVLKGDVFFTPSSETPEDIGISIAISENLPNTVYSYHLMRFRPQENILDVKFSNYVFNNNFVRKQMILSAQGIQRYVINKPNFEKIIFNYPNLKEQEKIGVFFSKLDKLIALHQSKFEKLQKIKKSCLQNLFPQNNQNTPKIRFKNFSDEWVKNKYKNIGQCLSGGTLSYEDLDKNGIYKCILYGELYTRYDYIIKNIVFRTNKLGNKVIKNDILFPQSTTVDAISLISPACMNDDEAQTSGVFAIRPHKNIDGNFITYYTKGNFYQRNKLAKNAQGLTIVHLYYQSIKDETILIPNLAEQCKISEFFTKLDKLIALHQSKFEKLQKIKKSCLQNMFV